MYLLTRFPYYPHPLTVLYAKFCLKFVVNFVRILIISLVIKSA